MKVALNDWQRARLDRIVLRLWQGGMGKPRYELREVALGGIRQTQLTVMVEVDGKPHEISHAVGTAIGVELALTVFERATDDLLESQRRRRSILEGRQ